MPESQQAWAEKIFAGERRAISRAISAVEDGEVAGIALLKRIFPKAGNSYVVGITGSPGAGKSTLVEKLAGEYRRDGLRVGILAVDPTSPFSGGAILGDRIRMQSLSNDDGVYIRSMATRGHLGGLTAATQEAAIILDAAGCRVILVETVGVGQDEVEIARHADATVLLLVPGMGDDVQTFKAGVMEIADIFVINKADRPGADRVEQEVSAMLGLGSHPTDRQPPIVKTVATTGEGVRRLREELDSFRAFGDQAGFKQRRQRDQWRARLLELLRQQLFESAVSNLRDGALDAGIDEILSHRSDPHTVAKRLIDDFAPLKAPAPKPKRKR
jgi:LAO/AO transport system kinase